MGEADTIILTGVAIENETATVILCPRNHHADGIDISISVELLEYKFEVETFFYGYNMQCFLREAEEVTAARAARSHLINYNQTLVLEFISNSTGVFLNIDYSSVLPQSPEKAVLKLLQAASHLESASNVGSRFHFCFMPLHNALSEISEWLERILSCHVISKENPYPQ